MPPGTSEVRHYHQTANQFFYVLRGHLSIEVGENELVLSPGQGVHITAGEPHQVRNRASVDAEFLVVSNLPATGTECSRGGLDFTTRTHNWSYRTLNIMNAANRAISSKTSLYRIK
jgi:uncharacterized cupin superfamily protein